MSENLLVEIAGDCSKSSRSSTTWEKRGHFKYFYKFLIEWKKPSKPQTYSKIYNTIKEIKRLMRVFQRWLREGIIRKSDISIFFPFIS